MTTATSNGDRERARTPEGRAALRREAGRSRQDAIRVALVALEALDRLDSTHTAPGASVTR